jgi:hypothetical protein
MDFDIPALKLTLISINVDDFFESNLRVGYLSVELDLCGTLEKMFSITCITWISWIAIAFGKHSGYEGQRRDFG